MPKLHQNKRIWTRGRASPLRSANALLRDDGDDPPAVAEGRSQVLLAGLSRHEVPVLQATRVLFLLLQQLHHVLPDPLTVINAEIEQQIEHLIEQLIVLLLQQLHHVLPDPFTVINAEIEQQIEHLIEQLIVLLLQQLHHVLPDPLTVINAEIEQQIEHIIEHLIVLILLKQLHHVLPNPLTVINAEIEQQIEHLIELLVSPPKAASPRTPGPTYCHQC